MSALNDTPGNPRRVDTGVGRSDEEEANEIPSRLGTMEEVDFFGTRENRLKGDSRSGAQQLLAPFVRPLGRLEHRLR